MYGGFAKNAEAFTNSLKKSGATEHFFFANWVTLMLKDMSNAYVEEHMRLKEFGNTLKATKTLITTQVGQLKKDRAILQK